MRLENVMQYQGVPGEREFSIGQFDVQAILLPEPTAIEALDEEKALATSALLGVNDPSVAGGAAVANFSDTGDSHCHLACCASK